MIHDPVALLKRLLLEPHETTWLEFKTNAAHDDMAIGEYVSSIANACLLAGKDFGYLVFGVEDHTRELIGSTIKLQSRKHKAEDFTNWLTRLLDPRIMIEIVDFDYNGLSFSIVVIEPSYEKPVKFSGEAFIRIGQNKKKLSNLPDHERALWIATGKRRFETAVAMMNVAPDDVFELLDVEPFYELSGEARPRSPAEIIKKFTDNGLLVDNMEGRFDITNLGAVLLARDITRFPSIASKSTRIIRYTGKDKTKSDFEQVGKKGYAAGFSGMLKFLFERLPKEERYVDGVRRMIPDYPETAIREVIANALIHQDFTITGTGPIIEIFSDRIEVTNPGKSLIDADRLIDERRSRNEKLAAAMRLLNLCEERGGGLDKTLLALEENHRTAPNFILSEHSVRVVLFGPRSFAEMTKRDKIRTCFFHCILRWIQHDYMSNSSLRQLFSLPQDEYQAVSALITELVREGRICPADPKQGRKNAKYVPYFAA